MNQLVFCICMTEKDVNECEDPLLNTCVPHTTCVDTNGSYTCTCDSRFNVGDGRSDGSGCKLSPTIRMMIIILPCKSHYSLLRCLMYITNFLSCVCSSASLRFSSLSSSVNLKHITNFVMS